MFTRSFEIREEGNKQKIKHYKRNDTRQEIRTRHTKTGKKARKDDAHGDIPSINFVGSPSHLKMRK